MKYLLPPLAIIVCLGLGACVYHRALEHAEQPRPEPERRALAVEVTSVQVRDIQDQVELVGSLEPQASVEVRARTRGYITALPFDVGDYLGGGEDLPVVVGLDDATAREMLNEALAALEVAEAQLKAKQAQADLARKNLQRQEKLAVSVAITQQKLEQSQAELEIANAEVELEQSRVTQARAEVQRHRIALDETRIVAPFGGFVAERFVDIGDLANPDDPLLHIVDISKVRTVVHVVERDYQKVRVGQAARIQVDAFPEKTFPGKVVRKAPVLDLETRTGAVHIEIDNPEFELKPGMYARVSIVADHRPGARVLPVASILDHTERPSVFVVEGQPPRARIRQIQTGIKDGEVVEVLGGVGPEDTIVTLGSHFVEDGQVVTPVEPTATEHASDSTDPRGGVAVSTGD